MDQKNYSSEVKQEILFRPITEGLGFHPFSDGLPYAPMAKGPRINAPTAANSPPFSAAVAGKGVVPQIKVPVAKLPPKVVARDVSNPKKETAIRPEETYGSVYLVKRFLAFFLDFALNTILCGISLCTFAFEQDFSLEQLFSTQVVIFVTIFVFVMNWILVTFQEVVFRTTLAKRFFGLKLKGGKRQCLVRALFFLPSAGFFGIGLLSGIFDPKKRCWHDRQTHLQPFEYARF